VTEPPPTSPFRRFPWVQLVFCLACLTMTAYTWMRYSYAWDLAQLRTYYNGESADAWPVGAYVVVHRTGKRVEARGGNGLESMRALFEQRPPPRRLYYLIVDGKTDSASRFHPASIAGIVVGATGLFIFGLYLRRWLREKKALAGEPQKDMIA